MIVKYIIRGEYKWEEAAEVVVEAVTVAGGFGGGHSSGGFSGGGRSSGGFSSSGSSSSYRSSRPIYGGPHYHSGGYGYGYGHSSSSSWVSILIFFIY